MWRLSCDIAQATGSSAIQRLWAPCSICSVSATKAGEREEAVVWLVLQEKKKPRSSGTHISNLLVCSTLKTQYFLHLPLREGSSGKVPFYPSLAKTTVRKTAAWSTSISPVRLQAGLSPQQANPQSCSTYTIVLVEIIQGMDTQRSPTPNTSMF